MAARRGASFSVDHHKGKYAPFTGFGAAVAAPMIHLGRVRLFGEDRHSRYTVLERRYHLAVD
jgi:hypothetical protein